MGVGIFVDGDIIITMQELQNMIAASSGSNTGTTTGDYRPSQATVLQLEDPQKIGVIASIYDPEWAAFMASEF